MADQQLRPAEPTSNSTAGKASRIVPVMSAEPLPSATRSFAAPSSVVPSLRPSSPPPYSSSSPTIPAAARPKHSLAEVLGHEPKANHAPQLHDLNLPFSHFKGHQHTYSDGTVKDAAQHGGGGDAHSSLDEGVDPESLDTFDSRTGSTDNYPPKRSSVRKAGPNGQVPTRRSSGRTLRRRSTAQALDDEGEGVASGSGGPPLTLPPAKKNLRRLSSTMGLAGGRGTAVLATAPWWYTVTPKPFRKFIFSSDIKILHEDTADFDKVLKIKLAKAMEEKKAKTAAAASEKASHGSIIHKIGAELSFKSKALKELEVAATKDETAKQIDAEDKLKEQREKERRMVLEKAKYKWVIHPESTYRLVWDVVTAFLVLFLIWLIPFYVGFETWEPPQSIVGLSTFMDVWFITDVVLNFRTGYVDHGATVMAPKKIAGNYLTTWFAIDFFASIPWEALLQNTYSSEEYTQANSTAKKAMRKSMKMSKYFKIPKLLRMARLLRAFNKYARFYALTLVIIGMVVTLHCLACFLAQALAICEGTFLVEDRFETGVFVLLTNEGTTVCKGASVINLYAEAIYVCFTLMLGMSPASHTLEASKAVEEAGGVSITNALLTFAYDGMGGWGSQMYILSLLFMTIGLGEFSLVVGHIGLLLRDRFQSSAVYRAKLDRVKEEMKYYGVPWHLQNRVLAYYDYMWVNQKQYDDKITLLTDKGMSSDLRGKLALHLYKDVVQGVSLFSRVDDTFLSKVCMELQTRVFLPLDWIILKGDIGSELYIISRGVCQVFLRDPLEWDAAGAQEELQPDEEEILLSNGQFFGEISLLMEVRRTTSVQAKTICEVNVLVQEIFEEILRESPDFADEMKSLIVQRKVENFKKLHQEDATSEDQEMIEAAVSEAIESRQLTIGGQEAAYGEADKDSEDEAYDAEEDDGGDYEDIQRVAATSALGGLGKVTREQLQEEERIVDGKGVKSIFEEKDPKTGLRLTRNSLLDRTASGLALGNMGGTGFIKSKTLTSMSITPEIAPELSPSASSRVATTAPPAKDEDGSPILTPRSRTVRSTIATSYNPTTALASDTTKSTALSPLSTGLTSAIVTADNGPAKLSPSAPSRPVIVTAAPPIASDSVEPPRAFPPTSAPPNSATAPSLSAREPMVVTGIVSAPPQTSSADASSHHPPPHRGIAHQTSSRGAPVVRGIVRQGTRADFHASVMHNQQMSAMGMSSRGIMSGATEIGQEGQGQDGANVQLSNVAAEDMVVQQLALLQERIDKIYAMLTTKLGRVR